MPDVVKKTDHTKILSHEPVPGYRKAYYIIMTVSTLYLAVIFIGSLL